MIIKTWRDPYNIGVSLTRPTQVELNPGLTILVGCNGSGKTTLIQNIKSMIKKEEIPFVIYDNQNNLNYSAGSILTGFAQFDTDDLSIASNLYTASEGESIRINIYRQSSLYKEFLKTGYFKDKSFKLAQIFQNSEKIITDKRRFFLYDATDSGLSIDNIIEIKELFKAIIALCEEQDIEPYVIISANEYELCRGESCFDVVKGKYITFKDYDDYRNFIINSRITKEKRLKKQDEWFTKQTLKEERQFNNFLNKCKVQIQEIKAKNYPERDKQRKIEDVFRNLRDFERNCEFYNCKKNLEELLND